MLFENKVTTITPGFIAKLLHPADEITLQNLCERCADFSILIEGRLPGKNAVKISGVAKYST